MPPQPSPLKAALMAPSKLRAEMSKDSVSSIIRDSGESLSITNGDFHRTLKSCPYKHLNVKGVTQAIKVHGKGTVLWSVLDEAGMLRTLKVPALYIPDVVSMNSLGDVYPEETVTFHPQEATMTGVPGDHNQRQINITRNPSNNLPTSYPTSIKEATRHPITWPTLSQPFITPISTSVQPKRNSYDGTTDWATWASREFNFS